MDCNNEYCTFCMFGQCCHESEEGFEKATPNELDCPSSVRRDLQYGLVHTQDFIMGAQETMAPSSKKELLTYIEEQRPDGDKRHYLLPDSVNIFLLTNQRKLRELLDIRCFIEEENK